MGVKRLYIEYAEWKRVCKNFSSVCMQTRPHLSRVSLFFDFPPNRTFPRKSMYLLDCRSNVMLSCTDFIVGDLSLCACGHEEVV
jgi:hypothetical protein